MANFVKLSLVAISALPSQAQSPTSTCSIISPSWRQGCAIVQNYRKFNTRDACLLSGCCYDPNEYQTSRGIVPKCYRPLQGAPPTAPPSPVQVVPATSAPVKTSQYTLAPEQIKENLQELKLKLDLQNGARSVKKTTTTATPTTTTTAETTQRTKVNEDPDKVVAHEDLMSSYTKKTCLQLSTTNTMNDTVRELTMDKLNCGSIQWQNYDPENDPNLQQSSEAGMQLLMDKLKQKQEKPTTILAGGKTEVIDSSGNVQMTLQAKLEEKIKKSQMEKKKSSSECKKLEENFAKQRKTRFSNKDEKKFKDICGFVPDAEYMFGLITSLQILKEEEAKNWKMPGMALEMELVDWPVIEKCIGRKSILNQKFNCFARTDRIWNKASCFNNGCIYHGEDCFYCEEAIENMKASKVAIEQINDGLGKTHSAIKVPIYSR